MELLAHTAPDGHVQTLKQHLTAVAEIAAGFASEAGLENCGRLIGLLHDGGKASKEFQTYLASATGLLAQGENDCLKAKGKVDHSTAGGQWLWACNTKQEYAVLFQALCLPILGHHGGLMDCLDDSEKTPPLLERLCKPEQAAHAAEAKAVLGEAFVTDALQTIGMPALKELLQKFKEARAQIDTDSDSCSVCDFRENGSCTKADPQTYIHWGMLSRYLLSCLIDADRIDSADWNYAEQAALRRNTPNWDCWIQRLEEYYASLRPAGAAKDIMRLRTAISDACRKRGTDSKGLYTLTVPTGGGKTLSGLRFALTHAQQHKMNRIVYVASFVSVIDQTAKVYRQALERDEESIVLEHHASIADEEQTVQSRLLSENWDAPVICTTLVQLLNAFFSGGTKAARRLHRLANSVIIFDEIQALPVSCLHLFCAAVNFLCKYCGSTVVLCTATPPTLHKLPNPEFGALRLGPENEIAQISADASRMERVTYREENSPGESWTAEETAMFALDRCKHTGSCLVIGNTRKWVKTVYEACVGKAAGVKLFYLTTDMCAAHRMDALTELRRALSEKDGQPVLCVATQLVEAGVDLDFATVIRAMAGLDSIVQAAGRCNRGGTRDTSKSLVHIIRCAPDEENLQRLRSIRCGKEAADDVLRNIREGSIAGRPDGAAALDRFFAYYFDNFRTDMLFPVDGLHSAPQSQGQYLGDTLCMWLSCNRYNSSTVPPTWTFRQRFQAAGEVFSVIDSQSMGVVVPYKNGMQIIAELSAQNWEERSTEALAARRRLLRQAQRFSVGVFPDRLKLLSDKDAVFSPEGSGVWCLRNGFYDMMVGLSDTRREYSSFVL